MAPPPRPGGALYDSLPGRLFFLSGGLLIVLALAELLVDLPDLLQTFRRVLVVALVTASVWLAGLAVARERRRLLWRVRRKLVLSYVFLGVVPVVLMAAFALAGGVVVYNNIAAYLFRVGVRELESQARQGAEMMALGDLSTMSAAEDVLARAHGYLSTPSPAISVAVVDLAPAGLGVTRAIATAGPWQHVDPPASVPGWVTELGGFSGLLVLDQMTPTGVPAVLVVRAAALSPDGNRLVMVDLPIDDTVAGWLEARTGTSVTAVALNPGVADSSGLLLVPAGGASSAGPTDTGGLFTLFRRTVAFVDYVADWDSGRLGRASVRLEAPIGRLYDELMSAQPPELASVLGGRWGGFVLALVFLGVLFLMIQGSALVMGALLARSITSAVHQLFVGTERLQQGDFRHRIRIDTRDQLGDLADSFNRMSGSIEHLLQVQREKQRLDDELRFAREIQKSLLPVEPPDLPGVRIAALCEPAREVGGDYYDFFALGPRRLGVLVADVAGKGTSAALYMAELKGLVLAMSHDEPSPRRMLTDLNQRLVHQLDSRSFITMSYAVIDLEARTLTWARAGHTPMVVVSGGQGEVAMPKGMVLGLQLPRAEEIFAETLEEQTRPLAPGDVIAFYTDGLTEAMNAEGDLFGEEAFVQLLAGVAALDPVGIRERVIRDVRAFVGGADPQDDLTMVVIKIDDESDAGGSST